MSDSSSIWSRLRRLFGGKKPQPAPPAPVATPAARTESPSEASTAKPVSSPSVPAAARDEPLVLRSRVTTVAAPAVDLILGVDLGTSCTKVVIGDPGWQDKFFAVPFAPADGGISAWFNPTRFGPEANLKMRLMNDPELEHVRDLLACYLAEVINHSRSWFDSNRPADYRGREIHWSLNLGFPDKAVDDLPLAVAYRSIARVAVLLASRSEAPSMELATRLRLHGSDDKPFIPSGRIELYPEIAAQLAGYVNSPYRQPGPLLLIDVGAGTLDVSTIILHQDHTQDIVSFFFCEVEKLGVLRLYEARQNVLGSIRPGSVKFPLDHFQDGSLPVPESLREMVKQSSVDLEDGFQRVSGAFAERIVGVALSCLQRFRICQKEIHASVNYDPWGKTLRFFLTGGGCRSAFYRDQLANGPLEEQLAPKTSWHREAHLRLADNQGLRLEPLPMPDNLQNFPSSLSRHFDRLSVAYGLAYGGENLMRITTSIHP